MKKCIAAWLAAGLLVTNAGAVSSQPSSWAEGAVQVAQSVGLVPEALADAYDQPITRAEFCSLAASLYHIWRADGVLGEVKSKSILFTDCTDPDVLLCAMVGVVNGMGDGRFAPHASITRQEAASMLHRLAALRADYVSRTEDRVPHCFADGAEIRSWAREDIYWAYHTGVMAGTGDNVFEPEGQYTREQSIITMLRLYDMAYIVPPEPEPDAPNQVVVDFAGAGVSRMHLEDAEGNRLLTDFEDTDGYFNEIKVFGEWVSLAWNGHMDVALFQPATGKRIDGYLLDGEDNAQGVAWAFAPHDAAAGRRNMVVYDDGTTGGTYIPATAWNNGRTLVWLDEGTLAAMDKTGKMLWQYTAPADMDSMVSYGVGDRLVIQQGETCALLDNGRLGTAQNYAITPDRWSTNYIGMENGWYTLYDQNGKALTAAAENALFEVGQGIYCRWVNDGEYEYLYCAEGGSPEVLYTVAMPHGRPGDLPTDGAGVYALRIDEGTVVCLDCWGDVLGTIRTSFPIDDYAMIVFENGCVRISQADGAYTALYLPSGGQLE